VISKQTIREQGKTVNASIGTEGYVQQEEFLTVPEVATILKVSTNVIRKWFTDFPGVIDCSPPQRPRRRVYRTLRIPRSALERFFHEHQVNNRNYEVMPLRGRR